MLDPPPQRRQEDTCPNITNMTSISNLETLLSSIKAQITSLASTLNETSRKYLIDGLRDLAISLERPQDSSRRLLYTQYQLMGLRIGCDLQLFTLLNSSPRPLTTADISSQLRASHPKLSPTLLGRLLRFMSSQRLIAETGPDEFAANNVTATFAVPELASGVYHYFDYMAAGVQHLPDFLKARGYADVSDVLDSPVPKAYGSSLPFFEHYSTERPETFAEFNKFMVGQRFGMPTWLDVYPYREAAEGLKLEEVFFVDVGGGLGHMARDLRKKMPGLGNRIVVQDQESVIKQAREANVEGVDFMVHDFWKEQSVKGARLYYLRNIMHDYPDDKALLILQRTREALGPDSRVLIDEMYLGNQNVHWQATQIDLTMMMAVSAVERTTQQWEALIPKAGLRIKNVYTYTSSKDSIIECVAA